MLKNYLRVALRFLLRNKIYTLVNISGLAIGMTACILIFLYVQDDLSYDRFNTKADRIWRILTIDSALGVSSQIVGITIPAVGAEMVKQFPEVVNTVRFASMGQMDVRKSENGERFTIKERCFADPKVFETFDFELLQGDKTSVLNSPNDFTISQSTAKRLFGDENPIGKILFTDDSQFRITGVFKDFPKQSHLQFDAIGSINLWIQRAPQWINGWGSISMPTYVELAEGKSFDDFKDKIEPMLRSHNVLKAWNVTAQPFTDVHLKSSHIVFDPQKGKSDITYIYAFSAIALFIIVIASFNFMNLSTSRSLSRAREVGLRKVVGANRVQLIFQFIGESLLLTVISLLIAVLLVKLFLPMMNQISGKELVLNLTYNMGVVISMLVIVFITGIVAGSYPAFVLSEFKPVSVLKGSYHSSRGGRIMRRVLVVLQFTISISLIIGTAVVYKQLNYMQNKKLGFNGEQVVVIPYFRPGLVNQQKTMRNELKKLPGVVSVATSGNLPGHTFGRRGMRPEGASGSDTWILSSIQIDYDFIKTMQMKIVSGRGFFRILNDSDSILLNRAAARDIGWEDPVGKKIYVPGQGGQERPMTVIGIVEDFHFISPRQVIEPVAIFLKDSPNPYMTVRITPDNISETLASIAQVWEKVHPSFEYSYSFLDEDFAELYKGEKNFSVVVSSFSILTIIIACLGLFGLASFSIDQRKKEIGIRKVLGASPGGISFMLINDFLRWVILANIFAWPLAYLAMDHWLTDFAYRVNMEVWDFVLGTLLALIISIATVSTQAFWSALIDPVETLRHE